MKRSCVLCLALCALLSLSACGGAEVTPSPSPASFPSPLSEDEKQLTAFQDVLEGIFQDHLYPNGDPVNVPEGADMENNRFALFDVDGDGIKELIYENSDSTMVGMVTHVFCYTDGQIFTEFSGFCGMTFYDNGMLTVDASHNHGLGASLDFWPYALYRHDSGSDGYLMAGYVDAWDGSVIPETWEGEPFPAALDLDGDQVLYCLTFPGPEVETRYMDGEDYLAWRDAYLADAAPLDLPFQSMTAENIAALTTGSY